MPRTWRRLCSCLVATSRATHSRYKFHRRNRSQKLRGKPRRRLASREKPARVKPEDKNRPIQVDFLEYWNFDNQFFCYCHHSGDIMFLSCHPCIRPCVCTSWKCDMMSCKPLGRISPNLQLPDKDEQIGFRRSHSRKTIALKIIGFSVTCNNSMYSNPSLHDNRCS